MRTTTRPSGGPKPHKGRNLSGPWPMVYRIVVNREMCESNAECVSLAPTVFELDDEELCVVVNPEGAKGKKILDAARACPTDAITLIDEGGDQVWP